MIEKVRIGAIDYSVFLSESIAQKNDLAGQICYASCEIEVDSLSQPQKQYAILLHEIVHGIFTHSKLDETLSEKEALLENVVEIVAHGLLGVIRDNPELIREIQELWK